MTPQFFTIYRGTDRQIEFSPCADGAIDISGWTIDFQLKHLVDTNDLQQDSQPILLEKNVGNGGIAIINALLGQYVVDFSSMDSYSVIAGEYAFDVVRTDPGNREVLATGTITFLDHVVLFS